MKIKNYIPVILCSIALCSCSDADKNIAFGLDSDAIKAEAAGGSHKIKVSASGDWVATTARAVDFHFAGQRPRHHRVQDPHRLGADRLAPPRRGTHPGARTPGTRRRSPSTQQGFDYAITLGEKEVSVANFSAFGTVIST